MLAPQALRPLLLAALSGLASPALATIYKCHEPGGSIAYQETPCPKGGTAADIRVHHPTATEIEAARQRGQQDKTAADKLDREQEARRREVLREHEERKAAERKTAERCARYLQDADTLIQLSQSRSKAPDRRRDERQAEELRNRHFSECYVAGR